MQAQEQEFFKSVARVQIIPPIVNEEFDFMDVLVFK